MENFNEMAKSWDDEPRRIERARIASDIMRDKIPGMQEMEGFEYGCGTGLLSFNLQPYLKKIWLGDSSEGMLKVLQDKIAKHSLTNMEPLYVDLTAERLSDFKCELVYTLMTLHHIQDIDSLLTAFHDMLNSRGYLTIVDLDKEDGTFHDSDFSGHNGFDRDELSRQLNSSGFEVLVNEICYNNTKLDSDGKVRTYPLFIMICRKKG